VARSLLAQGHELLAPDLLEIEAANALLKKVRRREIEGTEALRGIDTYRRVLTFQPAVSGYQRAIDLAQRYWCSTYDGVYVATAELADCQLVTADERLVKALGADFGDRVLWLGDMPV
jgi:predicted nucleic acid-binding protein